MFSPERTPVQVVFLPSFNDSDFHLAFDLGVLGKRPGVWEKQVRFPPGGGVDERVALGGGVWVCFPNPSVGWLMGCYCKTSVNCSFSNIPLHSGWIPGFTVFPRYV